MSAPAWTPGPWVIARSSSGYPYQIHAPNGSRGPGGIRSVTRWGAISMPGSLEGEANALLIAAAPDLALALRRMIADFGDYPASERPCDAFDLAYAALAKAGAA